MFFCSAATRNKIYYQTVGKAISAGFKMLNVQARFQALSKYSPVTLHYSPATAMYLKPLRTRRILQRYNLFLTHI